MEVFDHSVVFEGVVDDSQEFACQGDVGLPVAAEYCAPRAEAEWFCHGEYLQRAGIAGRADLRGDLVEPDAC